MGFACFHPLESSPVHLVLGQRPHTLRINPAIKQQPEIKQDRYLCEGCFKNQLQVPEGEKGPAWAPNVGKDCGFTPPVPTLSRAKFRLLSLRPPVLIDTFENNGIMELERACKANESNLLALCRNPNPSTVYLTDGCLMFSRAGKKLITSNKVACNITFWDNKGLILVLWCKTPAHQYATGVISEDFLTCGNSSPKKLSKRLSTDAS